MKVIIDERAWRDLDDIVGWLGRDNPGAGRREVEKVRHVIGQLAHFPNLAGPGRASGTWETSRPRHRYIIVFERSERPARLAITGIFHAARNR